MNTDQAQRRDIDWLNSGTVSMKIDEIVNSNSESINLLEVDTEMNNWYYTEESLEKPQIIHNDQIIFKVPPSPLFSQKNITQLRIIGSITTSSETIITSVRLNTKNTLVKTTLNDVSDVDITVDISEFDSTELNSLICDKGFDLVINFDYVKSNPTVQINELMLEFTFTNKLQDEQDVVWNRIKGKIFDMIYPIGSIYTSVNNVDPSVLFGGSWEKIEDKFLLASGNYNLGDVGGEATHKLTVDEMPSHNHTQAQHRHSLNRNFSDGSGGSTSAYITTADRKTSTKYTDYQTPTINNTGGGLAHNNMPPYLVINVWKRTG